MPQKLQTKKSHAKVVVNKRDDDKGNIPSPQNHIQQKMSNRKKMIPYTRMDDFLWG